MRTCAYGCMVMVAIAAVASAGAPEAASPEDRRLDATEFRQGLRQRGLTELLELYLREAPPADPVEALLLERDLRLAQHADPALPHAQRRAALNDANRTLERLIAEHADDLRAFDWRIQLGRSLLETEAEPYYSSILLWGGSAEDRRRLGELMDRAELAFARLDVELQRETARLEQAPPRTYEKLERSGHIERIERAGPQAAYKAHWAKFYRALAREPDDPLRSAELGAVLEYLEGASALLRTPHNLTHTRAQALLLAGMAGRLLNDPVSAAGYLNDAVTTVRRIRDDSERQGLDWVVKLALLETVRVHRDNHRFGLADGALGDLAAQLEGAPADEFALRLALALAESRVRAEQARVARAADRQQAAASFENMRFEPLAKFARQGTVYRDEIYAVLYRLMNPEVEPARLHPFEGCAFVAGLLNDATALDARIAAARSASPPVPADEIEDLESRRIAVLDRAISVAQHFHASAAAVLPELLPEMIYNLGVAHLQRGRRLDAGRMFLKVARDHPQFRSAQLAAIAAVQVASELAEDPSLSGRPEVQALYLDALQTLAQGFGHSDDARYWQFFLAQLLHDLGRYDQAAEAFALVRPTHEHYVHAGLLRIRAMVAALTEHAEDAHVNTADLRLRVTEVVEAVEAFLELAHAARADGVGGALLPDLPAEAELLAAEALLGLGAEQCPQALARLEGFEQRYPGLSRLIGRVLRVRIVAYEQVGRLQEAEEALPEYMRSDPEGAGATLQALFESIREDIVRLRERGRDEEADTKSRSALMLAQQIHRWASDDPARVRPEQKCAIDLQLARALLQAERYEEAQSAFAAYVAADAQRHPDGARRDVRALFGHGEALYRLKRYGQALPLFHAVCQTQSPADELWFQALLRDLQCRTELGHAPEGIIKVIRQQKFLHDDLGGVELRRRFDALLRRNQDRSTGGAESP